MSMDVALATLFKDFDRGIITRRQLLQALGIAALAVPMNVFGQGSCGGANAALPRCDTVPFKSPFEPTGWKTVLMDHFSMQVVDYQKEAAYYNALMGWKIRSDDGSKAVLDIGDWGGVVIRGGLVVPPPPLPTPLGDSLAAGRGGGAGGRGGAARAPSRAVWDSFCWGIDSWDTRKVEAELTKRGLNPIADHDGKEFQSFHVKDPDGFDLQISNGNRKNRRTTPANGALAVALPFEPTGWKSLWLDHISFSVTSYKETVAFYSALLGWKPLSDEGSQNECVIGPDIGNVIIRGGNANQPGGLAAGRGGRGGGAGGDSTAGRGGPPAPLVRRAVMNHVSFGIADFDPDKVKGELSKRGLNAREDTGATGDIHITAYKSYHTTTLNGYDLQISNKISG